MTESLHCKEQAVLEYLRTRYLDTMQTSFWGIPLGICSQFNIKDADELDNILSSLCIRNYIVIKSSANTHLYQFHIILTEKALNAFNAVEKGTE